MVVDSRRQWRRFARGIVGGGLFGLFLLLLPFILGPLLLLAVLSGSHAFFQSLDQALLGKREDRGLWMGLGVVAGLAVLAGVLGGAI
jgi:hypothetical protein